MHIVTTISVVVAHYWRQSALTQQNYTHIVMMSWISKEPAQTVSPILKTSVQCKIDLRKLGNDCCVELRELLVRKVATS